jgi:DNA-binding transcriptional ArsR family regulator
MKARVSDKNGISCLTRLCEHISILANTETNERNVVDAKKLARIFKALSAEPRVRIVQLLTGRALCVGALSARLDITQGAVSQHLRILRDAGLVVSEKRGYYVHYRLDEKSLAKWNKATGGLLSQTCGEIGQSTTGIDTKGGERLCVMKKKRSVRNRKT